MTTCTHMKIKRKQDPPTCPCYTTPVWTCLCDARTHMSLRAERKFWYDKIFREFLLRRCWHINTHEGSCSRRRDLSEGLVSASFSCVCKDSVRYMSPLHALLVCTEREFLVATCCFDMYLRHDPSCWPILNCSDVQLLSLISVCI